MTYLPKCPHCLSANIEPVSDKLFKCNDCGKNFGFAVVEEPPPPPEKPEKGEGK